VLAAVDQLVLHYDACGLSRVCFEILEQRGLSVHFLLDLDGTLYQTLDLADTAWHARQANGRSIGVEIANIGAYPPGPSELDRWYGRDAGGIRVTLPASVGPAGVRTPGFTARPARPGRVRGVVHGVLLEQHDFTPEQYEALARLSAALVRTFPDLDLRVPADAQGRIRADALGAGEYARFSGILGHQHVTSDKSDPGPAFDWVRFARRTRELAAGPRR
jgi:N-acetyl-anhydromuramyl-L-alanine amidase AmpD